MNTRRKDRFDFQIYSRTGRRVTQQQPSSERLINSPFNIVNHLSESGQNLNRSLSDPTLNCSSPDLILNRSLHDTTQLSTSSDRIKLSSDSPTKLSSDSPTKLSSDLSIKLSSDSSSTIFHQMAFQPELKEIFFAFSKYQDEDPRCHPRLSP